MRSKSKAITGVERTYFNHANHVNHVNRVTHVTRVTQNPHSTVSLTTSPRLIHLDSPLPYAREFDFLPWHPGCLGVWDTNSGFTKARDCAFAFTVMPKGGTILYIL